jgi:hypothetical protein
MKAMVRELPHRTVGDAGAACPHRKFPPVRRVASPIPASQDQGTASVSLSADQVCYLFSPVAGT